MASIAEPMLPEKDSERKAVSAQVRTKGKTANENNFRTTLLVVGRNRVAHTCLLGAKENNIMFLKSN